MADILRWEHRTTRKPHRCWGCAKEYPSGSFMAYAAYAEGGSVSSAYWCETCEEYIQRHCRHDDEYGYGSIIDNDPEGWEEIRMGLEKGTAQNECTV